MRTTGRRQVIAVAAALVVIVGDGFAAAQEPVKSFDQLYTRLKVGDTIWVTDAQGREVQGRVAELTPASLTLDREAAGRAFAAADVWAVRRRVDDSVLTGALIGFGTGLALGALALGQGDTDPSSANIVGVGLLF